MIQKIKQLFLVTVMGAALLVPAVAAVSVGTAVAVNNIRDGVCSGVGQATGNKGCGTEGQGGNLDLSNIAAKIVNIFSVIVGIVAVIMIIFGGFRYITSGGDSNRVGGAKNTLIYAIIGLIIVALAQVIVHYVLNTASSATGA